MLTASEQADHGQLGAAARTELERLRKVLDSDQGVSGQVLTQGQSGPPSVAVGPMLSDLAALHSAPDAAIELIVTDEPHAGVSPDCLAHVVTNLLANCAACARRPRLDDGLPPWGARRHRGHRRRSRLPPGQTAELLRRGTRGPSSTGTGLGLSVSANLVARYGGEIRLMPRMTGGSGCTAVVELPAAVTQSLDTVAV